MNSSQYSLTSYNDEASEGSDPASGNGGAPPPDNSIPNSTTTASTPNIDERRISHLRASMGITDIPMHVLRAILEADDRENQSASTSAPSESYLQQQQQQQQSSSSSIRRRGRRSWEDCQPAPSLPGVINVGGGVRNNNNYPIGQTDEVELYSRRINAVHQVQEALNNRLGFDLRASGQYEEMERSYKEGERVLSRRKEKIKPNIMVWGMPKLTEARMKKKEPMLPPPPEEPLPLPNSLLGGMMMSCGNVDGSDNTGGLDDRESLQHNGEICIGKFVDPGPDKNDEEEKREEELSISQSSRESWANVTVDETPMGSYDRVVRCFKCRAGLRVHMDVGLVVCPRCQTISPASDVAR